MQINVRETRMDT